MKMRNNLLPISVARLPVPAASFCCQFLLPVGSLVNRYVFELFFCEKSPVTQQTLKLNKKISTDLNSLEF
jgi:hypothetical protein